MNRIYGLLIISALITVPGCAARPPDPEARLLYERNNDPLEPLNRKIFTFNLAVENNVFKPVARGYRDITTPAFRERVRTFFANFSVPLSAVNDLLQLNFAQAAKSAGRFAVNSTLGFFGVFDVASPLGLPPRARSFDDTLRFWGVPPGIYLIMPFSGPSDMRAVAARAANVFLDPLTYASAHHDHNGPAVFFYTAGKLKGLASYEKSMDKLETERRSSVDFYAYTRAVYRQYQENLSGQSFFKTKAPPSYEFSLDPEEM